MKSIILNSVLLIALFAFTACENMFIPEPASDPETIFENFWQTLKDDYALFEERNVDWDELYLQYRPKVNTHTTESELYTILTNLIEPIDDGHIALISQQLGSFSSNKYFRNRSSENLFNTELIRNTYLEEGYKSNEEKYMYGKIRNHEIAYIHFDVFRKESVKLDELLKEYPDVKGYIVDLRSNNGGDVSFSFPFLGRFTKESRLFLTSKTKNGKGPNDYTPWYSWYLNSSGSYIDKPLVILTDRYTVSAAERMVMAVKTLDNVTIIGDTTNGTFGTKISRELANGWFYSYSIQKVLMFDGNSYEGIGLPPDIYIKNDLLEINSSVDKALQTAIDQFK